MKVVVNRCYGGFGLSVEAKLLYLKKAGYENPQVYKQDYNSSAPFKKINKADYSKLIEEGTNYYVMYETSYVITYEDQGEQANNFGNGKTFLDFELNRTDPLLIEVVEELGDKANDRFSELEIVEIPDDVNYEIIAYDGYEIIEEVHRSW